MSFAFRHWFLLAAALAWTPGCSRITRARRAVASGDAELAAGHYDRAEVQYQTALQRVPDDPPAVERLGALYFEEGRWILANHFLLEASKQPSYPVRIHIDFGLCAVLFGQPRLAQDEARAALKQEPLNEQAWTLLASSVRGAEDLARASQLLADARAAGPDHPAFHLAAGLLQFGAKNRLAAEKEFRTALSLDPRDANAWEQLGLNLRAQGRADDAAAALRKAADLAPPRSGYAVSFAHAEIERHHEAEAQRVLDELVHRAPDYFPAQVEAMNLAFKQGRNRDCSRLIERILTREPFNFEALLMETNLDLAAGNPQEAVRKLLHLEERYPSVSLVKLQLALGYMKLGNEVSARTVLAEAVARAPLFEPGVLLVAEIYNREGNFVAAIAALETLLGARPDILRGYVLLAQAYKGEGDVDRALSAYTRMQENAPHVPQPAYLSGVLLAEEGRLPEARSALDAAIRLDPNFVSPQEMLVNIDLATHQTDAAVARVERLRRQFPKSASPFMLQAKVDLALARTRAAEVDLEKAIQLDPDAQNAYLMLARLYVQSGEHPRAIRSLTAIADRNHSSSALTELALIRTELKQYVAAAKDYETLLTYDPAFVPALNNLAYLYVEHLDRPDRALALATHARQIAPTDPYAADTLGWILFRRGQIADAFRLVLEAAEAQPRSAEMRYHLGMIQSMMGDLDAARQSLAAALADPVEAPWKADTRARLEMLRSQSNRFTADRLRKVRDLLARTPDDPVLLRQLAELQQSGALYVEAAHTYEHLVQINSRDSASLVALIHLEAARLHRPRRALEWAKRAHLVAPADPQTTALLAHLLFEQGDFAWSLSLLQGLAGAMPPDQRVEFAEALFNAAQPDAALAVLKAPVPPAWAERARLLAELIPATDNPQHAAEHASAAAALLQLEPGAIAAQMVKALAAEARGDDSAARAGYETLLGMDPAYCPAAEHAAKLSFDRHDFEGAARWGRLALDHGSRQPEVYFYVGAARDSMGDHASAAVQLQQALDRNLGAPLADQARARLLRLRRNSATRT